MRGEVEACRSELGGLRVDIRLLPALVPEESVEPAPSAAGPTGSAPTSAPAPASAPAPPGQTP
jgi:hypothetical protein